jgi:hypothetical protein
MGYSVVANSAHPVILSMKDGIESVVEVLNCLHEVMNGYDVLNCLSFLINYMHDASALCLFNVLC